MIRNKTSIFAYTLYAATFIFFYQTFQDLWGFGIEKNLVSSVLAALTLIPFRQFINKKKAIAFTGIVQIALPLAVLIFSFYFFIEAAWSDILGILPEILSYCLIGWLASILTFFGALYFLEHEKAKKM